jgi:flagellar biosynthesis/type III secretory pathway protein FliH
MTKRKRQLSAKRSARRRLEIKLGDEAYERGVEQGKRLGKEQAKKEFEASSKAEDRKASYQMLQALSSMVESVSRAVIAFTTEAAYRP